MFKFRKFLSAVILTMACLPPAVARADASAQPPIVQKYLATMQGIQTLSADVTASTGGKAVETGQIVLKHPNKVLLTAQRDGVTQSTLVSNGKTVWQWTTVSAVKKVAPADLADINPDIDINVSVKVAGTFLMDTRNLVSLNLQDSRVENVSGQRAHRMVTKLKKQVNFVLWLADSNGLPLKMQLAQDKIALQVSFSHYAINQALPKNVFAATPPPGLKLFMPTVQAHPSIIYVPMLDAPQTHKSPKSNAKE